jgi:hypothetical protein
MHHVALALLPACLNARQAIVSFRYEQHSVFPRNCYTTMGWAEGSVGVFDGKYTTFFNQGARKESCDNFFYL